MKETATTLASFRREVSKAGPIRVYVAILDQYVEVKKVDLLDVYSHLPGRVAVGPFEFEKIAGVRYMDRA